MILEQYVDLDDIQFYNWLVTSEEVFNREMYHSSTWNATKVDMFCKYMEELVRDSNIVDKITFRIGSHKETNENILIITLISNTYGNLTGTIYINEILSPTCSRSLPERMIQCMIESYRGKHRSMVGSAKKLEAVEDFSSEEEKKERQEKETVERKKREEREKVLTEKQQQYELNKSLKKKAEKRRQKPQEYKPAEEKQELDNILDGLL